MAAPKDHRVEIYLDPMVYLALRARVNDCDRTISQHVRHLIRRDLEASIGASEQEGRGGAGEEGAEG